VGYPLNWRQSGIFKANYTLQGSKEFQNSEAVTYPENMLIETLYG
jgi:hypothetical protein